MTQFLGFRRGRAGLLLTAFIASSACTGEDADAPGGFGTTDGAVLPGTSNDAAAPGSASDGAAPVGNPPGNQGGGDSGASKPSDAGGVSTADASVSPGDAAAPLDGATPNTAAHGLP